MSFSRDTIDDCQKRIWRWPFFKQEPATRSLQPHLNARPGPIKTRSAGIGKVEPPQVNDPGVGRMSGFAHFLVRNCEKYISSAPHKVCGKYRISCGVRGRGCFQISVQCRLTRIFDLRKTPRIRYAISLLFANSAIILMIEECHNGKLSVAEDCKKMRV